VPLNAAGRRWSTAVGGRTARTVEAQGMEPGGGGVVSIPEERGATASDTDV